MIKKYTGHIDPQLEAYQYAGEYDFSEKVDFQAFNLDETFKDGAEI